MPRVVSGLRVARSYITPENTEVSRTIDFQLGGQQGIALHGVLGTMQLLTESGGTGMSAEQFSHTLHYETGSLESVPDAPGEDEDTIDSEIVYRQDMSLLAQDEAATRGGSAAAMVVTPGGIVWFPEPLYTARNITHRGIGLASTWSFGAHVLLYYKFVTFSLSEMGVLLARRA